MQYLRHTYTKKTVIYLKFKFTWVFLILSDNSRCSKQEAEQ